MMSLSPEQPAFSRRQPLFGGCERAQVRLRRAAASDLQLGEWHTAERLRAFGQSWNWLEHALTPPALLPWTKVFSANPAVVLLPPKDKPSGSWARSWTAAGMALAFTVTQKATARFRRFSSLRLKWAWSSGKEERPSSSCRYASPTAPSSGLTELPYSIPLGPCELSAPGSAWHAAPQVTSSLWGQCWSRVLGPPRPSSPCAGLGEDACLWQSWCDTQGFTAVARCVLQDASARAPGSRHISELNIPDKVWAT